MSRRRRAAEPAPEEEQQQQQEEEQQHEKEGLQFNEPLSWRAGRPIPTTELVKRLDKLSKELTDLDQEWEHKDSLNKVAKELSSPNILGHKDKGVKAFAACCLVDILKICAPDAPFTPSQLKDIFSLFINYTLPALQDPSSTWNNQHKYVLISLAEVQSVILLDDIDHNDELFVRLFTCFFDTVSGSKAASGELVGKDVEHYMTMVLEMLIDEASTMPPKVIDIIMAQFLRAAAPGAVKDKADQAARDDGQTTLLLKEEPAAYKMARNLCLASQDKMSRYVGQYFSDVIMDASGLAGSNGQRAGADSDDEDGPTGPSDDDLKELRKAHLLIRELWKAAPGLLSNVIPQLDAELSADNVNLRQLATETLGDVIAGIGAAGPPPPPALDAATYPLPRMSDFETDPVASNPLTTPLSPMSFAQTYHQPYQNFVSRKNDKSPVIRASWTTAVGYILSTNAGGIGFSREEERNLVKGLGDKLHDSDEKVRLAGVKAIESFNFRDLILKLASDGGLATPGSILSSLADRCRDRRPQVRVDAMALLGKLWAISSGELLAGNKVVVEALSAAPSKIYNSFYANDLEVNVLLDRVVYECLVPLSFPLAKKSAKSANGSSQPQAASGNWDADAVRVERILLLVRSLDPTAKKAFFAIQARQPQFAKVLSRFLTACEAFNGGVMDEDAERKEANLDNTIKYISQFLPDGSKAQTELHKFAKANDRRNYQLIKFIVGTEHEFKTARGAVKELIKRLQGAQQSGLVEVLIPLLYRSGYFMFNRSHLSTILDYSRTDKDDFGATAHEILNEISQRTPDLFKSHIGELCKDLSDKAPTATRENEPNVVETLKACASYARKYPEEIPGDRKFTQVLMNFALYGKPWKAAKYAVNILLAKKDEKGMVSATDLFQKVMKDFHYGTPHFLNKLAIVAQLELLTPKITLDKDQAILEVIQDILKNVRADASDNDPEWVDDAEMDEECLAKCLALKILANRLRAEDQDRGENDDPSQRARPVFRMFKTLIAREGDMSKSKETPKHHKARLRLRAAQLVLKLCKEKHLDDLLPPDDFNALAFVTQDAHPQTRKAFIGKLQKYLVQGKLRPKFYTIVFLTAYEPVTEFRSGVETWIRSRVNHYQQSGHSVMEAIMPRLISLLAHHPDLGESVEDLADHARYIIYYISNVATESNLGLIFRYAERVKQTRDAIDPAKSENLYVVSDLAQAVIRKWQEKRGWAFEAYGNKVGLPTGLFLALPSHDAAQEVAERQFVPEGIDAKLDEVLRAMDRKKKRKAGDDRDGGQPPAKKTKAPRPAQPKNKFGKQTTLKKATSKSKSAAAKPKKQRASSPDIPESERRRSGRASARRSSTYIERDSDDDDEEMLEGVAEWEYENDGEEGEGSEGEEDDEEQGDQDEDENEDEEGQEQQNEDDDAMDEDVDEEQEEDDKENEGERQKEAGNDSSDLSEPEEEPEEEEKAAPAATRNGRRGATRTASNNNNKTKADPTAKKGTKAGGSLPSRSKAGASKQSAAAAAAVATRTSGRSRRAKEMYD